MAAQLAEVVQLYETNASNIAGMLREAATNIGAETDEDDRTKAVIAVQLTESGGVQIYGWGKTDTLQAIGTLQLGVARLTRDHLGATE